MTERCPACGRTAFVDIGEIYPRTREIEIVACCEANREGWLEDMRSWTRKMWTEWLTRKTGFRFRQLVITEENWLLDYGLTIREIDWGTAKAFVAQHHEHNGPPNAWRFGAGIYNGEEMIASVIVESAGLCGARFAAHWQRRARQGGTVYPRPHGSRTN